MDLQTLKAEALALREEIVRDRRALHRHPELGGEEEWTQAYLLERLRSMGVEPVTYPGQRGVAAVIEGGLPGPTVGLRADMDALPVQEATGLPFASEIPGRMHACGHDAHMAIQLGAARLLLAHRAELPGRVKLLFEHAEETYGGAQEMIAAGCMENPHVDRMLGLHMLPSLPAGKLLTKPGPVSGSSTDVRIAFTGREGHGAYPERGVDAILIAAQAVVALQSVVSRNVSPLDSAVLSLGTIEGGKASNVVCGEVRLHGTLRTLRDETKALCRERVTAICKGVAESLGGGAKVTFTDSYGALQNDPALHARFEEVARALLGAENVVQREAPSLGVESFSFFVQRVPGVYYDLGCGVGSPLHACDFYVDEDCLPLGAALQAATAFSFLTLPA